MIEGRQKKVMVVDLSSGKTQGIFTPHPDYEKYSKEIKPKISMIDISSDGKHLLSIAGDGAVKVWDMADIQKLKNAPANNSVNIQRNNSSTHNNASSSDNSNLDLDFDLDDLRSEGEYHALIIAAENYIDKEINDLSNPSKDARALATVLQSSYLFKEENTTQLIDPTRGDIIQAFDKLSRKLGPLDNLLIFYAGHGYWDENLKQGYWFPVDAQKNYRTNWLSNADIATYIRGIKSKHILLITDACFSGSITRSAMTGASKSIKRLYSLASRRAMTSGNLAEVPDESVFTKYLIKALKDNQERFIPANDIFNYLQEPVQTNTNNLPQYLPIRNTGHEGGDFIFIKK